MWYKHCNYSKISNRAPAWEQVPEDTTDVFCKKIVLKYFVKITENTCIKVLFFRLASPTFLNEDSILSSFSWVLRYKRLEQNTCRLWSNQLKSSNLQRKRLFLKWCPSQSFLCKNHSNFAIFTITFIVRLILRKKRIWSCYNVNI